MSSSSFISPSALLDNSSDLLFQELQRQVEEIENHISALSVEPEDECSVPEAVGQEGWVEVDSADKRIDTDQNALEQRLQRAMQEIESLKQKLRGKEVPNSNKNIDWSSIGKDHNTFDDDKDIEEVIRCLFKKLGGVEGDMITSNDLSSSHLDKEEQDWLKKVMKDNRVAPEGLDLEAFRRLVQDHYKVPGRVQWASTLNLESALARHLKTGKVYDGQVGIKDMTEKEVMEACETFCKEVPELVMRGWKTLKKGDPDNVDLSGRNIGVTGARKVASMLKDRASKLTSLNLSENKLGDDGVAALFRSLPDELPLQTLELRGNMITDAGATSIAESVHLLTKLQILDMRNNNVQSKGASAIAAAVKCLPNLQRLDFRSNNLDLVGWRHVMEAAEGRGTIVGFTGFDWCKHGTEKFLPALEVESFRMGNDVAAVLSCWITRPSCDARTALTCLHLGKNDLGLEGIKVVSQALAHLECLKILDLRYNKMGPDGAVALASCLSSLTSLQSLDLRCNKLEHVGTCAIGRALKALQNLQFLNLEFNEAGDAGATSIGAALEHLTALTSLNLRDNQVSLAGVKAVVVNLSHLTSISLDLRSALPAVQCATTIQRKASHTEIADSLCEMH